MADTKRTAPTKRRWKRYFFGVAAVLLLLVLIYPLWFPWVLGPVTRQLGLQFENCQRHGYTGIELRNVTWTNEAVSVSAQRALFQMPHRWLWARLSGAAVQEPQVLIEDWRFESHPSIETSTDGGGSTGGLLDEFQTDLPPLTDWLRFVVLTNGEVQLPGTRFVISSARLEGGLLTAEALNANLTADLGDLAQSSLALAISNQLATADVQIERQAQRWMFTGGVDWQSNRFKMNGWFDHSSWLPIAATLGLDSVSVPSSLLGLGDFGDLAGGAQVVWSNANYRFDVRLSTRPHTNQGQPETGLSVTASGHGDLDAMELTRLELAAPFLRAGLDNALLYEFAGSLQGWNTTLNLWADLDQIESIAANGQLSGRITIQPSMHSPLRAGFSLAGSEIAVAGLRSRTTSIEGRIDWPLLQVSHLTAEMVCGGKLVSDFQFDVTQHRLRQLNWNYDGPWTNALPASTRLKAIHASGTAEGVWPDLAHTGRVDVMGLEAGVLRADLGRVQWSGRGLTLDQFLGRLKSGSSTFEIAGNGSVDRDAGFHVKANCDAMELVTAGGGWKLNQPVQFDFLKGTNGSEFDLSPIDLRGSDSQLILQSSIRRPSNGSGRLTVHGLRSSHLNDFLAPDLPELRVPDAALSFSWDNGPLLLQFKGVGEWIQNSNTVWSLAGHAGADGQSMRFNSFNVSLNEVPCVELDGILPMAVEPAKGWSVAPSSSDEGAHFDLRVVEQGPIWKWVEKQTGVSVGSPKIEFHARGKLPDLGGELVFNAGRLHWAGTHAGSMFVVPDVEQVHIDVAMTRDGIELSQAKARVHDQEINAHAHWAIDARNWTDWWQSVRQPDWKNITGSLRIEDAPLAAVSAIVPGVVAPGGEMDLNLSLEPGRQLTGHLVITNGATRFFKPVGSLRDINANISLDGWDARINNFAATLGGRPVELAGDLSWRRDGDRQFNLHLTGENLSLIRDPDLFVRADLDLHLSKSFDSVARLTGDVTLRRSLLFRDFNSLIGFDLEQPGQRPPYFSIPEPPFGGWQLDVRVKGDQFLDVFSTAFRGKVSAGLQLLGTLREPFAVGAVTVDSGKVLFPFGTLQIERGRVGLVREDPFRPNVEFRAVGRNFGYTITVEVTGAADTANLTFQSVPPLTAQQILLMLSAGEVPRSDFGYNTTDKAGRMVFYVGREFVNRFIGNTSTTERLTLRSGEYITDDGKPTYMLEYRFNDRWSVYGEYDRFRDFNSGLKFKVLSK